MKTVVVNSSILLWLQSQDIFLACRSSVYRSSVYRSTVCRYSVVLRFCGFTKGPRAPFLTFGFLNFLANGYELDAPALPGKSRRDICACECDGKVGGEIFLK